MDNNVLLVLLAIGSLIGAYQTMDADYFGGLETQMKASVSFGILVLVQALFGGRGFTDIPSNVENILSNDFVKFLALFMVTFSGTQDIEASVFIVIGFLSIMQLLRNKEERDKHPYLI